MSNWGSWKLKWLKITARIAKDLLLLGSLVYLFKWGSLTGKGFRSIIVKGLETLGVVVTTCHQCVSFKMVYFEGIWSRSVCGVRGPENRPPEGQNVL